MVKKKDLLIMSYLRNNARETLTSMSKKTNIPVSTIYEKIKNNSGGLIKRHTTLVDFQKLGFSTWANIMLKVKKEQKQEIRASLMSHPNVNSLYKINNGYDFMIEVVFRNINDLEEFIDEIEEKFEIEEKNVYYIIDEIKRESFMADPSVIDALEE